ncbi:aldehyde reductase [Glaciihabitans arcticus]|uniref:Aldehyde reductase n=1 Tax=Glaciihabitans arcticus TaxID=2668039 RepID=A0A4Q9GVL8_9MICO|nr:aldehyde reductase [Glaciihabitans arcticus]TBN57628.1 aldehyde reductase [Glaciihabitans arcticus]
MTTHNVLVTGGSGFIAGHVILQLLEQGHGVRATLRSRTKEASVRAILAESGMTQGDNLSFVEADLLADDGWAAAVEGVDYVLHVASPVLPGRVENEDDVIRPAREGTLRVLRAARAAGVKRLVLTSAFHAVSWGHAHSDHIFTEADWTVLDGPGVDAYGRAKTLAERAAWDLVEAAGGIELTTMLPVAVMGPVMGADVSGANHIVQRMLNGGLPAFPDLYIPIVDVRDVAAAHIAAMTAPGAAGQRFLISNGPALAMKQIGAGIRAAVGDAAAKVPTRAMPSLVIRIGALFNQEFRGTVPDLGYSKKTSNERARTELGWTPRPAEQAIAAAAQSMITKGLAG